MKAYSDMKDPAVSLHFTFLWSRPEHMLSLALTSVCASLPQWSQCVTNSTLVLSWLEPNTLYCVHVESLVPGPPRLPMPSQKQCISTLEGKLQEKLQEVPANLKREIS
jgi:hypothetical protein